jgi:hypothetical protein
MKRDLRDCADFALTVFAIGGNGEGWTLNDAVVALRVGLGLDGVNEQWREPVSEDELARLELWMGPVPESFSRSLTTGRQLRDEVGVIVTLDRRKDDDSGWWLTGNCGGLADYAIDRSDSDWTVL